MENGILSFGTSIECGTGVFIASVCGIANQVLFLVHSRICVSSLPPEILRRDGKLASPADLYLLYDGSCS